MLRKIEGRRRKEQQKMRWFGWYHRVNGHESEQTPGDREGPIRKPGVLQSMGSQRVRHGLKD